MLKTTNACSPTLDVKNWCLSNSMNLVVGKTTFISFTRKTNSIAFTYKLDFSHIACFQRLKDLGGTFIDWQPFS